MRLVKIEEICLDTFPIADIVVYAENDQCINDLKFHEITKRDQPIMLGIPVANRAVLDISHLVFQSIDYVFRHDLVPIYKAQRMSRRMSDPEISPYDEKRNKRVLVIWCSVFDKVFAHVWEELEKVYNIDFYKMM